MHSNRPTAQRVTAGLVWVGVGGLLIAGLLGLVGAWELAFGRAGGRAEPGPPRAGRSAGVAVQRPAPTLAAGVAVQRPAPTLAAADGPAGTGVPRPQGVAVQRPAPTLAAAGVPRSQGIAAGRAEPGPPSGASLLTTRFKYPLWRQEVERAPGKAGQPPTWTVRTMVGDHILVKLQPGHTVAELAALNRRQGATLRRALRVADHYLVAFAPADLGTVPRAVAAYRQETRLVAMAEPDYVVTAQETPNDPLLPQLWGLHNDQRHDISAPSAWAQQTGSTLVLVGVVDSGIDYYHPDLAANVWTNPGEIPGDGLDNDHNGYVDDVHGYNFADDNGDPFDDYGHGSHVSGIIGAVGNNGVGGTGVCWTVRLVALKFLNSGGSGAVSDAIEALHYATDVGCQLTNHSWGGVGYSTALESAIAEAGDANQIVVAAAGNNGVDLATARFYPASSSKANVVAVGASDNADQRAGFSNYGATTVDLFAPGDAVLSTYLGSYQYLSGTSMATPCVTGTLALLLSGGTTPPYTETIARLLASVTPVPSLVGQCVSGGRLNAGQFLTGRYDVQAFAATAAADRISLSWTRPATAGLDDVVIRRQTTGVPTGPTVGDLVYQGTGTSHQDAAVTPGVRYYYAAFAHYTPGGYTGGVAAAAVPGGGADYFTQQFASPEFDLAHGTLTFTPTNDLNGYTARRDPSVDDFPTSPAGGTTLGLDDDDYAVVDLLGGAQVLLYGKQYDRLYVGSNGYVTFGYGDREYDPSLAHHFALPRVSGLFGDLDPTAGGTVSWRQTSELVAVTFAGVPHANSSQTYSFQMEFFFDGRLRLTHLGGAGTQCLVGLSAGKLYPLDFAASDLTHYSVSGDLPTMSVPAVTGTEGEDLTVTVSLAGTSRGATSVTYTVADGTAQAGTDFEPAAGTLRWGSGQTGPRTFLVQVRRDDTDEPDETAEVRLSEPLNATLANTTAALTIQDADPAPVLSVSSARVFENAGPASVMVTMVGRSAWPVTVQFATSAGTATAGSDYQETATELTWPAGSIGAQTVTIPINDDDEAESDETVTLALTTPVHADLGQATATLTIQDDDSRGDLVLYQGVFPAPGGTLPSAQIGPAGVYLVCQAVNGSLVPRHTVSYWEDADGRWYQLDASPVVAVSQWRSGTREWMVFSRHEPGPSAVDARLALGPTTAGVAIAGTATVSIPLRLTGSRLTVGRTAGTATPGDAVWRFARTDTLTANHRQLRGDEARDEWIRRHLTPRRYQVVESATARATVKAPHD